MIAALSIVTLSGAHGGDPMLTFDRLHSHQVEDGKVIFRVLSTDDKKFEFALTQDLAGLMFASLQAASERLPSDYARRGVTPNRFQPAIGPDMNPALLMNLGGNLELSISLPPAQLKALKAAIAELEAGTTPGRERH